MISGQLGSAGNRLDSRGRIASPLGTERLRLRVFPGTSVRPLTLVLSPPRGEEAECLKLRKDKQRSLGLPA